LPTALSSNVLQTKPVISQSFSANSRNNHRSIELATKNPTTPLRIAGFASSSDKATTLVNAVQPEVTSAPATLTVNSNVFAALVQDLLRVVGFPLTSYKNPVNQRKLPKAKASPAPVKAAGIAEKSQIQSCTIGFKNNDFDDKVKPSPVKFRGRVIGQVASPQKAQQMARQLELGLGSSTLVPADIQPALVKGVPVIKVNDRVLLSLGSNPDVGECKPELLALIWVNNLRTALAEDPLSLVSTQEKMLNLQPTEQLIEGMASWYGPYFHGRQTATGEIFDQNDFTAAHQTLPFDTYLKVIPTQSEYKHNIRVCLTLL
jgi:hypothetical protein